jgi:hypothetical protein
MLAVGIVVGVVAVQAVDAGLKGLRWGNGL